MDTPLLGVILADALSALDAIISLFYGNPIIGMATA